MKAKRLLLLTILCCTLSSTFSQSVIGRQQVDQFPTTSWNTMTYGLTWLPNDYSTNLTQKYPLIIFLHGVGETGDGIAGLNTMLNTGLPMIISQGWDPEAVNPVDGQNYKFIVVSPQAPTSAGWSYQWNSIQYILPDIINRYRVDTTRIYLTGLSAGGNATWTCLTSGPGAAKKFAAAVPVASAPLPLDSIPSVGSQYGVKLWNICGDQDAFFNFSTSATTAYNSGIPAPNPAAALTVFNGQGHWPSVWNTAYSAGWNNNVHNKNIYQWMLQYKRTSALSALSVNAGANQTISLPLNQVSLSGVATPAAGDTITSYNWSKLSGPTGDVIVSANTATTMVTGLVQGVHIYKLTVISSNDTAWATVQVTVNGAANVPPSVNAGVDTIIQLPADSVQLTGSATDADGSIVSYNWSKISGPSSFVIVSSSQPQTMIDGLVQGIYGFELTVTDNNGAITKDTVMVTVTAAQVNQLPLAFAGNDATITLPVDSIQLNGTGTDSDGTIVSYSWQKIAGPLQYNIGSASQQQVMVTGLVQGQYKFELTVTDNNGAIAKDTVTVTVLSQPAITCNGIKRYMIPGSGDDGKFITSDSTSYWYMDVNPGDTLVLGSQYAWSYFRMENYAGTSACPIVIINEGGQVWMKDGVYAKNCQHLKITGSGAANVYYGIKVYSPVFDGFSVAIDIQGRSNNIEVERIDVLHKGYGVWAKQDPLCDPAYNYPNYVMDSIEIHHCRFKKIWQDCIYAGNTDPLGERTVWCNGVETHPIPMRMSNVNIHHLIIDSCGRTGIQLGGAHGGINRIHDNIVTNIGYEYNQWQGAGISIGAMTRNCYVYNNVVKNTFIYGIFDLGADSSFVYNNVVDSSGFLKIDPSVDINSLAAATNCTALPGHWLKNTMSMPASIQATTKPSIPHFTKTVFYKNNKVGVNATAADPSGIISFGWWGPAEDWTANNKVCGNTKLDGITPAKIDPFWYTTQNQYWPVMDTLCSAPVPNMPPTAFAGNDTVLAITADSVMLTGSGTDADGTIVSYQWEKIGGPAQLIMTDQDSTHNLVHDLVPGIYTFRLKVTDNNGASATDDVRVFLAPPNQAPIANSGPYKIVTLPSTSTILEGNGIDPNGDSISYHWTKLSGPSQYNIVQPTQASAAINNLVPGVYWFELKVTDVHGLLDRDTTRVDVNIPPTAYAGPDQVITLPVNTVNVHGSAYDADGTMAGYTWTKISGPSSFNITSPAQAQTSITSLAVGVYYFEFKAMDNFLATARDTLMITVLPGVNTPPVAHAGSDIVIQLPVNQVTLNGSGTDGDGSVVSYAWSYIGGPAGYSILSPSQPQTSITNLVQGVYTFRLTVTDNLGAVHTDDVSITVLAAPPPTNVLPVANAGNDITIILPQSNTTLSGSGTDSDGSVISYNWNKVSGPVAYLVSSPAQAQTGLSNLEQGIYLFELTVMDNDGAIAKDTVQVTVLADSNLPPSVNAGNDIMITLPVNNTVLSGSGNDSDGNIVSWQWTKISGPGSFIIVSSTQWQTMVSSLVQGVYHFELTVTDNDGASTKDTVMVTVLQSSVNLPPVAHAGNDINIIFPVNTANLNGSGTDADGTIVSYQWKKIDGPPVFLINNTASAQTQVTGLLQGSVYSFELTVTDDDGATGKDTVLVIVNSSSVNLPPVAYAGNDQTILLPQDSITMSGYATDADGSVVSYKWTKISGPMNYSINSPNDSTSLFTDLEEGEYLFEFRAIDNWGAIGRDTVKLTVVNQARFFTNTIVYPNPASSEINVRIVAETEKSKSGIMIYDARGALVYSEEFLRTERIVQRKVPVYNLVRGNYFVVVKVDIDNQFGLKFIKH